MTPSVRRGLPARAPIESTAGVLESGAGLAPSTSRGQSLERRRAGEGRHRDRLGPDRKARRRLRPALARASYDGAPARPRRTVRSGGRSETLRGVENVHSLHREGHPSAEAACGAGTRHDALRVLAPPSIVERNALSFSRRPGLRWHGNQMVPTLGATSSRASSAPPTLPGWPPAAWA